MFIIKKERGNHIMNYEIVTLEEKLIAGLTARTGNNDLDWPKLRGDICTRQY